MLGWHYWQILRNSFRGRNAVFAFLFLAIPVFNVLAQTNTFGIEIGDPIGRLSSSVIRGIELLLPIMASFLGLQSLVPELLERYISQISMRLSVTKYLLMKLAGASTVAFALFYALACIDYFSIIVFLPNLGTLQPNSNPVPSIVDDYDVWGPLYHANPIAFGFAYAAWFGMHALIWSTLAFACVLIIRNLYIGLIVPVGIFLGLWLWFFDVELYKLSPLSMWGIFTIPQMQFVPNLFLSLAELALVMAFALVAIFHFKRTRLE
jgi:hypothetical protein